MKCIFCKNDSTNSKSVEHIIPESLGNKRNILPKGVVCDDCNNYFGNKIEKIVLEMTYFKSLRSRLIIENKKGKLLRMSGLTEQGENVEIEYSTEGENIFKVVCKGEKAFASINNGSDLYIPFIQVPPSNDVNVSKFIGKIALEAFAQRLSKTENWQNDFVEHKVLDELRYFVRYGKGYTIWPYNIRRISDELEIKYDKQNNKILHKLNEYDFLIPDKPTIKGETYHLDNLYFVLNILGIEYSINLTNSGLNRYLIWLSDNQNKSILQIEKSEFHSI
jgi:hypothetical protein